ncbi:MAG: helix-turn-helix domain-containing protein [Pseudomonadota bacterium]
MLSGRAAELVEAIGEDRALALLQSRGGTEINIPVHGEGSQLERILGTEACARMIAYFGPGKLRLPMGPERGQTARRARGMQLFAQGRSTRDVAQLCDVAERTAERWKSERHNGQVTKQRLPAPERQLLLPFDTNDIDRAG